MNCSSALDDQHENCLIEIMVCCVREAATGEYPIGRGQPNRKVFKQISFIKFDLLFHLL